MVPIANISHYNQRMNKSMEDKLFFLEKINAKVFLDYGCADGAMIEVMANLFPEFRFFGYDNNLEMIALANAKKIPNAIFSDNLEHLINEANICKEKMGYETKTAIVLSSIVHEIYAYLEEQEILDFWDNVFFNRFDYIVIRDMALSGNIHGEYTDSDDMKKLSEKCDKKLLKEFQQKYGPLSEKQNFIHFLLKYRYTDNWERELNEDYTGFNVNILNEYMLEGSKYEYAYLKRFTLPFLKEKVKEDFDIDLNDNTHIKIVLERTW